MSVERTTDEGPTRPRPPGATSSAGIRDTGIRVSVSAPLPHAQPRGEQDKSRGDSDLSGSLFQA
jgi:hypothetical protein